MTTTTTRTITTTTVPKAPPRAAPATEQQVNGLYRLTFLLTGNAELGVYAVVRALDFEAPGNPVFRSFLSEWARKLAIAESLGLIEPELRRSARRVERIQDDEADCASGWNPVPRIDAETVEDALLSIDAFPRAALLLLTFERMPLATVAALLSEHESLVQAGQRVGLVRLSEELHSQGNPI